MTAEVYASVNNFDAMTVLSLDSSLLLKQSILKNMFTNSKQFLVLFHK